MNNKGFTLVELIATIVVLAIVMSIATFSITSIIKNAKQKNYDILINNIRDASELYYQECKYVTNSGISCEMVNSRYEISLGELVVYGYLKGNNPDNRTSLISPLDDHIISDCRIGISNNNGIIEIIDLSNSEDCPNTY